MLLRTGDAPIAGQTRGHSVTFGGAIGWRPNHGPFVVGPEVYGSASVTEPSALNTPVEAVLGAHYTFAPVWRVNLGVGPGLSSGLGTPALRTVLSLEYFMQAAEDRPKKVAPARREASDRDADGVPDTIDACPDKAGPQNVDPALNGCPAPPDTDGDGVADDVDACPDDKGTPNPDRELNGCPPDADQDGIPDSIDACPLRAGVEQADKTQNGCPPDSDRDGILDEEDACPDVPGAKSSDPRDNGCPIDRDRDHDGIPNEDDACPREAGPRDPDPRKNGCPKAVLRGAEIRILDQVRFEPASARIVPGKASVDVLTAVKDVLVEHPEITKIEVQGHTDNRGDPKANKRLSLERARAVVKWLVAHGLPAARFTAVGYGDERPLDSNATDAGRQTNRRVEFHATETAAPSPKAAPPAAPTPGEKQP
jgi:outer membrane protein OmpA-like peptidoglycan-associated protein